MAADQIEVPWVLYQGKPKLTPGNEPSTSSAEATVVPASTRSSHPTDEATEFGEENVDGKYRFD